MFSILSPQHAPSVYPIPAATASGVLRPISVRLYKYPWSLLFFFIPIPLAFRVKLRNPIAIVELGSSV